MDSIVLEKIRFQYPEQDDGASFTLNVENFTVAQGEQWVKEFDVNFNSIYQDGPISLNSASKMLYLTRTTNKIKNNKNIQLDIFQVPFKNIGKELPYPMELNVDGFTSFHPSVSPQTECFQQPLTQGLLLRLRYLMPL